METLIPINVIIGDRNYRVRIEPGNEGAVRKTVKVINDKIVEFKTNFAGKDMQDYIAMVILWFATQEKAAREGPLEDDDSSEKLGAIEALLERYLQK